jgi:hypothetical protein
MDTEEEFRVSDLELGVSNSRIRQMAAANDNLGGWCGLLVVRIVAITLTR